MVKGCPKERGSYPGSTESGRTNPIGVARVGGERGHNPVGVETRFARYPRVARRLATLGWRTQSLWDCFQCDPGPPGPGPIGAGGHNPFGIAFKGIPDLWVMISREEREGASPPKAWRRRERKPFSQTCSPFLVDFQTRSYSKKDPACAGSFYARGGQVIARPGRNCCRGRWRWLRGWPCRHSSTTYRC